LPALRTFRYQRTGFGDQVSNNATRIVRPVSIVSTNSLTKRFGEKTALDRVTLEVQQGDLFGLFGPNGAGKTTLLRILTGQLEQDSGTAQVIGLDVRSDPLGVKRLIGIVPEVESPPTYLTAYEYLYFVAKVRKVEDIDKKIDRWFDFFDLKESRDVICRDLSKGMRQKIMLASAFIHEPKLLFLDEPFINLDPIYQRKLREYLLGYVKNGGTAFMCSHLLEIAERLCNRAAIISEGRMVKSGTMAEIVKGEKTLEDVFLKLVSRGE
jgi:ABC-2 type transport system ATP-binding protein